MSAIQVLLMMVDAGQLTAMVLSILIQRPMTIFTFITESLKTGVQEG